MNLSYWAINIMLNRLIVKITIRSRENSIFVGKLLVNKYMTFCPQ